MVVISKCAGFRLVNGVTLAYGHNLLNAKKSKKIMENGGKELMDKHPSIKYVEDKKGKEVYSLSSLTEDEAVAVIYECWMYPELVKHEEYENSQKNPRTKVLQAVQIQKGKMKLKSEVPQVDTPPKN